MIQNAVWIFILLVVAGLMGWVVILASRARRGWIKWPGVTFSTVGSLLALTVLILGIFPIQPDIAPVPTPRLAGATGPAPATMQPTDTQHELPVHPGESIQTVIDRAVPGDTIVVFPGVYHESIRVNTLNITLLGEPGVSGEWPILDGQAKLDTAVLATANFFTMEQFQIRDYTHSGVKTDNVYGAFYHSLSITNPGQYGVYPVQNTHIVIQNVKVSGAKAAGIFVGQSRDVLVEFSEAFHNTRGIEIESSVHVEVLNNSVHDNTLGILMWNSAVQDNEQLSTRISRNRVEDNNEPAITSGQILQSILPGIGLLVSMTGPTEVGHNIFSGNNTAGIGVAQADSVFNGTQPFSMPQQPGQIWLHDNEYSNNGRKPAEMIILPHYPGADIFWDASSWETRFDDREAKTFPPLVPTSAWPDLFKRAIWRVYRLLIRN